MDHLDDLENRSIYLLREARRKLPSLAMLWSIGKDSTTLLWLARRAFFGRIPFPLVHIDTSYKHPEMIRYRDAVAREWGVELIVGRNEEALAAGMSPQQGRFECCTALKTRALQSLLETRGYKGVILGIRRDEEGSRAKERYFSPRDKSFEWNYKDQPPEFWEQYNTDFGPETHLRIHPLLHWTELDIWQYVQREQIPVCPLYLAREGKRFRSLGCVPCNSPLESDAATVEDIVAELRVTRTPERAGRAQDHEQAYSMQKLRALGYM
ncbi:MAG: sulfate adenylyltransferase subunit 2 [Deltaproteobacteria bacterium]|nr:sulfate adenylyltransferase subunit 2 [Deltaproteobacteria bacterium]